MSTYLNNPAFFWSTSACKTQKTLPITTKLPVIWRYFLRRRHKIAVLPLESCSFLGASSGSPFPSKSPSPNNNPKLDQQIVWNSFTSGHGSLGITIKPGHVHLLIHLDILSSKHDIQIWKLPFIWRYFVRRRHKIAVLPLESCSFLGASSGSPFPSKSPSPNNNPKLDQQIVWNSFTSGHGSLGITIKPGHVHLLIHLDILSSKHDIQIWKKIILNIDIPFL